MLLIENWLVGVLIAAAYAFGVTYAGWLVPSAILCMYVACVLVEVVVLASSQERQANRVNKALKNFPNCRAKVLPTGVLWVRNRESNREVARIPAGEW